MGGGSSRGGVCAYKNQGQAIDEEKNNIYRKIRAIRNVMNDNNKYDIFGRANKLDALKILSQKITALYNTALEREKIRDDRVLHWDDGDVTSDVAAKGVLQKAIRAKGDDEIAYYNNVLIKQGLTNTYASDIKKITSDLNKYETTLENNNEFQATNNQYNKGYYDKIYGQNSVLTNRKNNKQYLDLYSSDGQKSIYGNDDNEYLKSLNYVFLMLYYILAIAILYIIYLLNITNFSKIVMVLIILLYPLFIYSLQHSLHYLWLTFNKAM